MSYSLCLSYKGDKYYIHKAFSYGPESPKVSHNNQNNAMLFETEQKAKNWADKNNIPEDYQATFIVMQYKYDDENNPKPDKPKYNKINAGDINQGLPDFLK